MRNIESIAVARKLSAIIMKQESIKEARLYYALRFIDSFASGNLLISDVLDLLGNKDSGTYLLDRRYLKDRIKSGNGIFWVVKEDRIWLLGLEKILVNLDGNDFGKYAARLSFDDVFTSHKRFKRALYEIVHCTGNDHPIARETLTEITGLGRKAQRNLEGWMCVEPNFARTNLYWTENNVESMRWHKPHMFKMTCKVGEKIGDYIGFQIANTYTPFDREVEKVSCSIKKKNKTLALLNRKNGANKNRDREGRIDLIYGTTEKEIDKLRDGSERTKFTYYYRSGQWKAVLPTELYEETFNKEYDGIMVQLEQLGLPVFAPAKQPSPPVPKLS